MTEIKIKPWMLISEVAEYFRRSERTIRRWLDEDKLVGGKPERRSNSGILILGQSVLDFEACMIANLKEDPAAVEKQMEKIFRPRRKVYSRGV